MQWSVGRKIGASFGVVLLITVVIGAAAYNSTAQLLESETWLTHTHQVLTNLAQVMSSLVDAETGQRGYIITGNDRFLEPYRTAGQTVNSELETLKNSISDNPVEIQRVEALEPLVAARLSGLQSVIDLRRSKGLEAASNSQLLDQNKAEMDQIRRLIREMMATENDLLSRRSADEAEMVQRTKFTIILGTLISLLVSVGVGLALTRDISTPLRLLANATAGIARGNLAVTVPVMKRSDEMGILMSGFREMTESMQALARATERIAGGDLTVELSPRSDQDTLGLAFSTMGGKLRGANLEMQRSVTVLSSSAHQIVATVTQLASGAAQTATAVTETTTTVEEVKQTAVLSAQKARYVSDTAQKAIQVTQAGMKAVDEAVEGAKRTRANMESIADSIVRLSEQGQNIAEIIATVRDLAEQSNLLAVNAAIEAAKAGEHGKGFSVVAQEVRSLAEQSKAATTQIRNILTDLQKATSAAAMVTEQGSKAVEAGVKQSVQAGESVQKLSASISVAAQAATQIAASSQQQIAGMDQVAVAMESIKLATAQNVAGTRQTEAAARNMQELGQKLSELVSQYRM
jgi:methyl-accepting chemotaxis protein